MEFEPLAPKPQPVFGQGFEYNGRLTVKGIPRAEPIEIERLIFAPEGATPNQIREWRTESLRTVTKPWLEAQARHYGMVLGPRDNYSKDELQDLLRREFFQPDFSDIRRQYKLFRPGQFEMIKADWEAQCAAYKDSCFSGRRQADFDNLATLEEKLNFDIDMFLETYYSDRDTLPDPMPFRGINFDIVTEAVAQVPGLYAQRVGTDFQKMLWIGWDKKEVKEACKQYAELAKENAATRRLLKEQNSARAHMKKIEKAARWRLQQHRDYVDTPDRSRRIQGSYVVEVNLMGFERESGSQWVDIRSAAMDSVYEVVFNFMPALEGVMILSQNEEDIQKYIDTLEPREGMQPGTVETVDLTVNEPQPGSKRKRKQDDDREQGRADDSTSGPTPKRMRPDMPDVFEGCTRYYARWRGSIATATLYMGTERIRDDGENEGWVDFLEDEKAQFIAHCKAPLLGGVVHGYKVSDETRYEAVKWTMRPRASSSYNTFWSKLHQG